MDFIAIFYRLFVFFGIPFFGNPIVLKRDRNFALDNIRILAFLVAVCSNTRLLTNFRTFSTSDQNRNLVTTRIDIIQEMSKPITFKFSQKLSNWCPGGYAKISGAPRHRYWAIQNLDRGRFKPLPPQSMVSQIATFRTQFSIILFGGHSWARHANRKLKRFYFWR